MRVLEVSLRKAGFTVTTATSVQDGLDKLELHAPDLIISETTFPDGDGFELRRRVRSAPDWAEIPFIFLTAEAAIENKIKGLELGVDDYLTKPIYIKEIVTRINILLQKRQRARFEERRDGRTRFAGRVSDMPVVDVIQTIEVSRKSGVIQFVGDRGRQATIYFRDGNVIDAESGTLQGEDAVYRLLTWNEGEFEVVFRTVRRRRVIETSSQGLLMEGMRRLDEWSRLLDSLPPVTHRFEVDAGELSRRLGDVPDDNNGILRLIDGKRTLLEVIDASDVGDLECLQAISRLYFEDMLMDLDHDAPVRRDTGRPMPLVEVESSSPIEVAAADSGEHDSLEPAAATDEDTEDEAEGDTEETQAVDEPVTPVPGELMGGYRPSSLRLIDEAVAAAQAIEPSLFDDMPSLRPDPPKPAAPAKPSARDEGFSSFGSEEPTQPSPLRAMAMAVPKEAPEHDSVPQEIAADEPPTPRRPPRPTQPSNPPPRRTEDSGLRMIGSHGRDRAEASGELGIMPRSISRPPIEEAQRELVTILPRRTTREVPVVAEPASPSADSDKGAVDAETLAPSNASKEPTEPKEPPYPSVRLPILGTGTSVAKATAAEDPRRDLAPGGESHEAQGPGAGAKILFVIAALLIAITVYLWVRDRGKDDQVVRTPRDPDEPLVVMTPEGADGGLAEVGGDGGVPSVSSDGGIRVVAIDGGVAVNDAGVAHDAGAVDQSKVLREQADSALQEGDAETALQLAEQSIRMRRTARAYLVKAQALQRLSRFDEAFDATHDAEEQAPNYPAIFEIRGAILWQQGRIDEAKEEYRRFLELEPNGEKASRVRRRIGD